MLKIEFATGNAAFEGTNEIPEVLTCLDKIKGLIYSGRRGGKIMDSNGNCIGHWTMGAKRRDSNGTRKLSCQWR